MNMDYTRVRERMNTSSGSNVGRLTPHPSYIVYVPSVKTNNKPTAQRETGNL
jgi:hypothetical protein